MWMPLLCPRSSRTNREQSPTHHSPPHPLRRRLQASHPEVRPWVERYPEAGASRFWMPTALQAVDDAQGPPWLGLCCGVAVLADLPAADANNPPPTSANTFACQIPASSTILRNVSQYFCKYSTIFRNFSSKPKILHAFSFTPTPLGYPFLKSKNMLGFPLFRAT